MSAGCALAMLCEQRSQEPHEMHTTRQVQTDVEKIEQLETLLRHCSYKDDFMPVKNLLKLYSENGITQERIAEIFGCSQSLVSKFLNSKTPGLTLVTAVHKYFEEGGDSLVLPAKPKRTASDQIWGFFDGVGKIISSCSSYSNSSSRTSTPPASAEERQTLLKKKRE